MYIPDEKVEEVRAATDIVDLVSDYVRLKRRGANFVGLCPFHDEKTPSFNVNPGMGIFKCFGCNVGGDAYQFVMRIEGLGFPESVRTLAERAGVPLPEENAEDAQRANAVESIYHALRFAARFFYEQLTQEPSGKPALGYLLDRGFTPKTIKAFGLGYAPDRWDALLEAAEAGHVAPETLEKAGLVIPRKDGSGYYDRYRNRVIFPIFSHVGKVLGFGGRIMEGEEGPKYINSPETEVYNKSRILYGLYQGKQAVRKEEEVILVEGYTDVISLHQAGVAHVVASSGTALTLEQVKALGRYAKRVLFLYDADAAGAGAALRGIDLVLEQGLAAYAVALPGGEDPDSYVRAHGGEAFRAYASEERQDFVAFKYAQARSAGLFDTPEGEAEAIRGILQSVARIPDKLMRDAYVRRTGEVVREPDLALFRVLDEILEREHKKQDRRRAPVPQPPPENAPEAEAPPPEGEAAEAHRGPSLRKEPHPEPTEEEKTLLQLMLQHGAPMVEHVLGRMSLEEFTEGPARTMAQHLVERYEDGRVSPEPFLNGTYGEEVRDLTAGLLMPQHQISENWERKYNIEVKPINGDAYAVANAVFLKHRKRLTLKSIRNVKHQIFLAGKDEQKVERLQMRLMELFAYMKELDPELSISSDF